MVIIIILIVVVKQRRNRGGVKRRRRNLKRKTRKNINMAITKIITNMTEATRETVVVISHIKSINIVGMIRRGVIILTVTVIEGTLSSIYGNVYTLHIIVSIQIIKPYAS